MKTEPSYNCPPRCNICWNVHHSSEPCKPIDIVYQMDDIHGSLAILRKQLAVSENTDLTYQLIGECLNKIEEIIENEAMKENQKQ